jgi:hypothetical protein
MAAPNIIEQPKLPRWLTHLPPSVKKALEALSPYERKFVQLYCGDCHGNGVAAMQALRSRQLAKQVAKNMKPRTPRKGGKPAPAGSKKGIAPMTYSTAASKASQILMRPHVRMAVNAWMEAFAMSAAEVTAKIGDLAHANMAPFLVRKFVRGKPVMVLQANDHEAWQSHIHWVKKIETSGKTGQIISMELHDAFAAQKEIGKILKLTSDQPILALNLHFQQLSDDEVLAELGRAHAEIAEGKHGEDAAQRMLLGQPVAVVEPPVIPDAVDDDDDEGAPPAAPVATPPRRPRTRGGAAK